MAHKVSQNKINLEFIRNIPLFSGLSEIEKDTLLKDGGVYSYPHKNILFRQGDPVARFYIICSGTVRLFHETPDGQEVTSHMRIAGDSMCATDIFLSGTHHTHAEALSDVTTFEFTAECLRKAAQQYGKIASYLLFSISRWTHKLEMEVEKQSTMTADQLVACFLKRTCHLYGFDPKGFDLPYSKALIASRLGMTHETLSRTLPNLETFGITVKNKHVVFHDLAKIEQNTCSHCPAAEAAANDGNVKSPLMYKCGIEKYAAQFSISRSPQGIQHVISEEMKMIETH